MEVIKDFPPIIDKIREKFTLRGSVVFTWGSTIYAPSGIPISDDVMIHEIVHEEQQAGDPASWWERYLDDADFRFGQELKAYRAQYRYFRSRNERNKTAVFLRRIAKDLSSSLYGNCINFDEAMRLLKL